MGISETIGYYVNQWWFPFAAIAIAGPIGLGITTLVILTVEKLDRPRRHLGD